MGEQNPEELKEEGLAQFKAGHREEALALFSRAAVEFEKNEDPLGQAEMYNNIGVIQRLNHNWTAAEEALIQAERIFGGMGDDVRQAQSLGNLGDLSAKRKEYPKAEKYYSESSELFSSAGQTGMQADVLRALGIMQIRRRKWWSAVDAMQRSLKARPRLSIPQRFFYWLLQFASRIMSGGQ